MRLLRFFITAIVVLTFASAFGQPGSRLSFNRDGRFRIAQFTDIHWCDDSIDRCQRTLESIQAVIDANQPDINVLSGDIVTSHPAQAGWQSIIRFFSKQNMPFVVEMGNHDAEFMSRDSIYTMLMCAPNYAGTKGNQVSGFGNITIPVYASDGSNRVKNVIFLLDSNDYPTDPLFAKYDWIHFDQIAWYRTESDRFASMNGGKPVPSVAFFHIPLPEANFVVGKPDTFGSNLDKMPSTISGGVNGGLFASMLDKGNIVGVFSGHNHLCDYVGILSNIALGYGRNSGWNAWCSLERGGRIVELHEGSRHFDTWNSTARGREAVYHYPAGITSIQESQPRHKALKVSPKNRGVAFTYYEGAILHCQDVDNLKPLSRGVKANFIIDSDPDKDHFAYDFHSLIKVPESGIYKFRLRSDDGAQVVIDGTMVIDNDGSHDAKFKDGLIGLDAGFHDIKVRYFEDYMGQHLELRYQTVNIDESPVTDDMLFVPTK